VTVVVMAETEDFAADRLVLALGQRYVECIRINQDELDALTMQWTPSSGLTHLRFGCRTLSRNDLTGVWFRRLFRRVRDDWIDRFRLDQWETMFLGLDASTDVRWMNRPSSVLIATNKLHQLAAATELGLRIPPTVVTNSPDQVAHLVATGRIVGKAVVSGGGVDPSGAYMLPTVDLSAEELDPESVHLAPLIVQERVVAQRDLRITIVNEQVFGASIEVVDRAATEVDWRTVTDDRLIYEGWTVPDALADQLLRLMCKLDLTFAAADLILTPDDEVVFLELNPGGQWGWLEPRLGFSATDAIVDFLTGR
jgi:glutathione synthase/RimK-type ligase-like ATP-grasp enzyme